MSVIDEIKDRLDIVEVVGGYTQLKKAGRTYKGLCPFHNEKTPSFVVFPDSQSWHCFGACGTGGDVFSFVMKRENVDFGDALALLAAKAGVELRPQTEAASAEEERLERLRAIQSDAALYFSYLLNKSEEAAIGREYLERRGLSRETWEAWQLGYSLDSWDALKTRLQAKGYRPEELEEAGVVIRKEETRSYYDRFRGRLMIPIRDGQGRTVGFGARILREDVAAHGGHPGPKYINSPQTPLFDKGTVLFGLDMARKAIRDANLAVIVEGYMDVLMSHQVGVANVVAGMGTALTEAQMRQIKRYTSNVTLALDPDVAGEHAAARGLEAARQSLARDWEPVFSPTGLLRHESRLKAQLRIAALPDGLDPDELAYRDVERWRQVIREARPIVDYYLAQAASEEDLTTGQGKARTIERLAPLIQEIANPVERQHYVQALARLLRMDERLVTEQVARGSRVEERTARTSPEELPGRQPAMAGVRRKAQVAWAFGPEEYILGWLALRPELLAGLDEDMIAQQAPPLSPDDLSSAENQALLATLLALPPQAGRPVEERLADLPDLLQVRVQAMVAEVRRRPPLTDEKLIKDLGDSLLRIRERNLKRQVQQLEFLIRESTEADESRRLHELMTSYTAQKRHIQKLLNMRSIAGVLAQRKPIGEA